MCIAACGGTAVAPSPSSAPSASAAAATATQAPATTAPGVSLGALVAAGNNSQYKVTYQLTSTAQGQSTTFAQTVYVKGTSVRYDFGSPAGGSISFFSKPDGTVTCIQAQNICTKGASAGGQLNPSAQLDQSVRTQPGNYSSTATTTRTIAGTQAQCFTVADRAGGQGTMCYSAQGIPLFTQWSGPAGTFTMEATAVSSTVSDDDLKPYAPVVGSP